MPEVTARYDYVDEFSTLIFQVERLNPKGFRQRRPDPERDGEWVYETAGVRRVPYHLPDVRRTVLAGGWIFVVEGEKDADTLRKREYVATTLPGGAGKWRKEYAAFFEGAKVAIIADADGPGRKHALQVANELDSVVAKLLVYDVPAPHKDVTELLDAGRAMKDLILFPNWRAERPAASDATQPQALRVISVSELMATPEPRDEDLLLDSLVVRGSRLVIGGHSGEGKTTLGLQILSAILRAEQFLGWRGHGNGTRALVLDAEQGRRTVKRRFAESGLDQFPDKVDLVHVPDGLSLDSNERQVDELDAILRRGRYDVVLADPLYKLHRGDANDERSAVDLMRRFDAWREEFKFALVLPMHCRKPQPGHNGRLQIHDLMGSSAYSYGAEVVVAIQRKAIGFAYLYWLKDREGDLGCIGERWGLQFDVKVRRFSRATKDIAEAQLREQLRRVLTEHPAMTVRELSDQVGGKAPTIRNALEGVGAVHDGVRNKNEQRWSLPPALFKIEG